MTTENVLFTPWDWDEIINYTDHMMHTTYSHLPAYLIGVLVAEAAALTAAKRQGDQARAAAASGGSSREQGSRSLLRLLCLGNAAAMLLTALLPLCLDHLLRFSHHLSSTASQAASIRVSVMGAELSLPPDLLRRSLIALYIPAKKLALTASIACTVYCLSARDRGHGARLPVKTTAAGANEANNREQQQQQQVRPMGLSRRLLHALGQVSFTMFLVNLLIIRLDFYSARHVTTDHPLTMARRVISLTSCVVSASVLLHLLFIQALDGVRRKYLSSLLLLLQSNEGRRGEAWMSDRK